ncbi:MAG: diacylglycerol kinase family protein [Anaerolineae bacterium]|nr:diacylglycerol kinase family protein [Anaerolineae bacterium]
MIHHRDPEGTENVERGGGSAASIREALAVDPEAYSPVVSKSRRASLGYALAGWAYMLRYQTNIRIQLAATVMVVVMGLWLGLGAPEWALLVLVIGLNFLLEFINAAIEAAVNLASPGLHPMARIAKDVAAGATLLAAVIAVLVGLLVMGPPLLARLGLA